MRVVLDEGVPRELAKALSAIGVDADPFDKSGKGLTNGALLARAEATGDAVLLTNDKNFVFQQNLQGRPLGIVVLPMNLRRIVMGRIDDIADTIRHAKPERHVVMNADGTRFCHYSQNGKAVTERLPSILAFWG